MAIDQNRWTLKVQEAMRSAVERAHAQNNPEVTPDHILAALLGQADGLALPLLAKAGVEPTALTNRVARPPRRRSPRPTAGPRSACRAGARDLLESADSLRGDMGDEYVSVEHLLLALSDLIGVKRDELLDRAAPGARQPPRHVAEPRGPVPGARALRARPDRAGPPGQARPGHRPRRGDPPRHPGPEPPHQEQPRAHRRARRGQDRHRGGPRQPHRRGGRPRGAARQARGGPRPLGHGGRRQVPRRVRGAPEGGAQGDHRLRGRDHHLHRRAPHHRGRGRGRRGHGRRQHDQAHAGARRAAPGRGHDARRVPQVHREGRRARAPLPARLRGPALGGGHHRHPARAQGALRGPPRRAHPGRRPRGRGGAVGPLRDGALPPRQGHRPHRRVRQPAAHRDRLHAHRDRRGHAAHAPARDRAHGPGQGDRRRLEGTPGPPRGGAGQPDRAGRRHDGALAGRRRTPSPPSAP